MYRCVQCILWRNSPEEEIDVYKSVTYEAKPAAFLAIRAMHQLADDEETSFPIEAKIVKKDFYVDDLMSGGNTIEEVQEIRMQVKAFLSRGSFPICKWCSNEPRILDGESEEEEEKLLKFHDGTDIARTLGLIREPSSDNFLFNISPMLPDGPPSKRSVLSVTPLAL